MTWLTLTEPRGPKYAMEGGQVVDAPQQAAPKFYIRADIVTEIVPGAEGETIIRTMQSAQYICAESAVDIMARIEECEPDRLPLHQGRALG